MEQKITKNFQVKKQLAQNQQIFYFIEFSKPTFYLSIFRKQK